MPLIRPVAAFAAERGTQDASEFLRERYFELHSRRVYFTPAK
ncbi:hypothetical protein [Streptosporangium saharense]